MRGEVLCKSCDFSHGILKGLALAASALVLHERITIPMLAGMLLILGGVSLARRGR